MSDTGDPFGDINFGALSLMFGHDPEKARLERAEKERAAALFASGRPFPPTDLPPELLDIILAFLPSYTKKDYLNLCLVSRAFLPHAQRALYSAVEVNLEDKMGATGRFLLSDKTLALYRTMTVKPDLAALVTEVHLAFRTPDCDEDLLGGIQLGALSFADSPEQIIFADERVEEEDVSLEAFLPSLFARLGTPTAFSVSDGCPYPLAKSFLASLSLPSVTHVSIGSLSPAYLAGLPSLIHLHCAFPKVLAELDNWPEPPKLESLTLAWQGFSEYRAIDCLRFFTWLTFAARESLVDLSLPLNAIFHPLLADFKKLSSLEFHLGRLELAQTWFPPSLGSILDTLSPSLRHLKISDSNPAPSNPRTYLAHLPSSLHTLEIDAHPFQPDAVFSLLERVKVALPELVQLTLADKPSDSFFGLSSWGQASLWEKEDWEKANKLCEEKGLCQGEGTAGRQA
ncbi:hypothetical protein JCM10213_007017 [Rhodosporidiobolus nylandii]